MVAVAFSAISWRLVEVQALSSDRFEQLGRAQRVREVTLAAERGAIFDRDGNVLALSVPQRTVWADPRVVRDPEGYAAQLAPLLHDGDGERPALEATLAERMRRGDAAFVYLQRKVDEETASKVEALALPGVGFVPESERHYPSELAGSVLGMVGVDNQGLSGLELQHEEALSGKPGELVVERDPEGREIPQGSRSYTPAEPGSDLVLTLDHGLQFEAERALVDAVEEFDARGGRAIVMDVATADVLAMANVRAPAGGGAPRPDPRSGRNRSVTDVYEPGSTNKVITVASALEEGLVSPSTTLTVPDHLRVADHVFTDHEPHPTGEWSVRRILVHSSNVGAIKIGGLLGKERLDRYLRAFGFGSETGLGFPGEAGGLLLDAEDWYPTSRGTVPIGNGLAVTAIQMLNVYVTIANDGIRREPRLVSRTVDHEGRAQEIPLGPHRRVVSEETAGRMRDLLAGVVAEGTGTSARIPGYTVAGKTGTARKPLEEARGYSDEHVASFVGFAPADDPRLAAIVVLDEPTPIYGGVAAAPTFARIMEHALRLAGVAPARDAGAGSDPSREVPEVPPEEPPPGPPPGEDSLAAGPPGGAGEGARGGAGTRLASLSPSRTADGDDRWTG